MEKLMEKLMKLLNEYEKDGDWYITYTMRGEKSGRELKSGYMFDEDKNAIQNHIISKNFGFIKRLVDNDKIDFEKNKLQVLKDIDVRGEVMYDYTLFDKADGVIMLLAISDNPIDLLCERLK